MEKPSIAVLYQFFPPDDVVSSVLIGDLCAGLADSGWNVSAHPCVWSFRDLAKRYRTRERWRGVSVKRIWRPNLPQASAAGRVLNAAWMIFRWSWLAMTLRPHPDILLVGTDPVLSVVVAFVWRLFSPRTKLVHWCFDLYPEAAIEAGIFRQDSAIARWLHAVQQSAYQKYSLIVDLGPCMRDRLEQYPTAAARETVEPWAIDEPDELLPEATDERVLLFGKARPALLYSGSFGRAHSIGGILSLASLLKARNGKVVFSTRGNCDGELKDTIRSSGVDIGFVPFAPKERLRSRLASADAHLVSLHPRWAGIVIPSKFFGALSAGRPVIFAGGTQSSVARWIQEFSVGWVLTDTNSQEVCDRLVHYVNSPSDVQAMRQRCFRIYREHFSKRAQIGRFNRILRDLLSFGQERRDSESSYDYCTQAISRTDNHFS